MRSNPILPGREREMIAVRGNRYLRHEWRSTTTRVDLSNRKRVHTRQIRETYVGIDTAGQPSWRRFLARYSGAGASIAGAECLAGRTGVASALSGVMDADGGFSSHGDTCNRLVRSTVLELDDFGSRRDTARRNGDPSSLSGKQARSSCASSSVTISPNSHSRSGEGEGGGVNRSLAISLSTLERHSSRKYMILAIRGSWDFSKVLAFALEKILQSWTSAVVKREKCNACEIF